MPVDAKIEVKFFWFFVIILAQFKKMLVQKRREQLKDFEKQERKIKELKSSGQSTKKAVSKVL